MTDRVLQLLGLATKAGKAVNGEFAVEQKIKEECVCLIIIAADASANTKKHFNDMCSYRNIPVIFYGSKEQLGKCTGKEYRASIGVTDKGFADKILSLSGEEKI